MNSVVGRNYLGTMHWLLRLNLAKDQRPSRLRHTQFTLKPLTRAVIILGEMRSLTPYCFVGYFVMPVKVVDGRMIN
jgi:hypothetical protein